MGLSIAGASRRQVTVGETLHPDLKTSDTDVILTSPTHKARQRHVSKRDRCVSASNEHLCETTLRVM
jgi:pterin-4a-carbinolamine dehydratase